MMKIYINAKIIFSIIIFFLFVSKTVSLSFEHRDALQLKLKNIYGQTENIIPSNGNETIIFLGGQKTKTEKIRWYKEISTNIKDSKKYNLTLIVQLSDLPVFIPKFIAENKVKEEIQKLKAKYYFGKNVRVLFDWGKELGEYYNANLDEIKIIIIDGKGYIKGTINGNFSYEKLRNLKHAMDNINV